MGRLKITVPNTATLIHKEIIPVLVNHINYGNHLGHDSLISILQESRICFLKKNGIRDEISIDTTVGLMVASIAVTYLAEAFHGDNLLIEILVDDITKKSCDLYYRVAKNESGQKNLVSIAVTNLVFLDFKTKKLTSIPPKFQQILNAGFGRKSLIGLGRTAGQAEKETSATNVLQL